MTKKFNVLLVYPNLMFQMQLPSNIPLLSACLKQAGYDVKIFDTTLYKTSDKTLGELREDRTQVRKMDLSDGLNVEEGDVFKDFRKIVKEYNPNLIGVSVVDSTIKLGIDLINSIPRRKIPTIFGGKYAIFSPEELQHEKAVDIICIGEGEESLVELCDCLKNNKPYEHLENLWVKKHDVLYKNKLKKPVELDTLPFEDFSIFDKQRFLSPMRGKMLPMLPINFDRGCPHRCKFCAAPTLYDIYREQGYRFNRQKSVDMIYKELKYQINKHNIAYLYFNSETFLSKPLKQLEEFEEMYSEFNLPFWCQTRLDSITDEKMQILEKMNCDRVAVSIEHGNEEFRNKILKKKLTNKQIIDGMKILNKYNMKIGVNNILGFPGETRGLVFDTINLCRELKFDSVNGFAFQPYRGSDLREVCIEKGYISQDSLNDIHSSIMGDSILDMPQFKPEEIEGLLRTFVLYVRLPKKYYPQIKIAEQLNKEGDKMLSELQEVFYKLFF